MSTSTLDRISNGRIEVRREPLTYERHGPNSRRSFLQDVAKAELRNDRAAIAQLERHEKEMRVELPALERRAAAEGVEYEKRVNPSRIEGQGKPFAPPLWVNEYFATAPRPKRVLADMIPSFDLPDGVSSVNLPLLTTGTETGTPVDVAGVPERDILTAASESTATTIEGMADTSLQLLEQSPAGAHLDWALFKDLNEASDASLEEKLFTGTGKNQTFTGLLNLPTGKGAVSSVSYTDSTPTAPEMFLALGKVGAQAGDARQSPPECWLMRTARWAWLGSGEDKEELPLAVPGHQAIPPVPYTFDENRPAAAPPILGWPNYLSDAIPATLGAGGNQDCIVAIRPTDMMLFENDAKTRVILDPVSGTLGARFILHRYAAVLWRYPTAIATLTGTGLIVQSEY